MTTRIAFLRAVNVGGRTVPMSRLVEVFGGLGYEGAWTHINSGNVVFEATGGRAALDINMPNYVSAIVTTNEIVTSISAVLSAEAGAKQ